MHNFLEAKKLNKITRERKSLIVRPNGRSADWIIPSLVTGCDLACSYCYTSRHRAFGNPVEAYTNLKEIWSAINSHWIKLGPKTPNQCDPLKWTYDIGENTDCLGPSAIEQTKWIIKQFIEHTNAKPTFATKIGTGHKLLEPVPNNSARVRVSLMPQDIANIVEVGTTRIEARIASIDLLLQLGYEVHLNFSPVIATPGWVENYRKLMKLVDKQISQQAKEQLKAEVIFLTHHPVLHKSNLNWIPAAEELLWTPKWQESKTNNRGDSEVVRYKHELKIALVNAFKKLIKEELPYCKLRYIF